MWERGTATGSKIGGSAEREPEDESVRTFGTVAFTDPESLNAVVAIESATAVKISKKKPLSTSHEHSKNKIKPHLQQTHSKNNKYIIFYILYS